MEPGNELLERLLANLVDNAITYNAASGRLSLTTATDGDGVTVVTLINDGAVMTVEQVTRALAPFRRLDAERTGRMPGFGLGLPIVSAIASAHGAQLTLDPLPGGGLQVVVRFAS